MRALLDPSPLLVTVLTAGLLEFARGISIYSAILGWALGALVVYAAANFFGEIVAHRARGEREWPVFSMATLSALRRVPGALFVVVLLLAAQLHRVLVEAELWLPALAIDVILGLLLPLSAALLAVTGSVARALNPIVLMAALIRIGGGYWGVLLGIAAVSVLSGWAMAAGSLVVSLVAVYGWNLLAFGLGDLLYARRLELGVTTRRAPEDIARRERDALIRQRSEVLSHAYGFASRGNGQGALRHIREYVDSAVEADPLEAQLWFAERIQEWPNPRPAIALAEALEPALRAAGRDAEAMTVASIRAAATARLS